MESNSIIEKIKIKIQLEVIDLCNFDKDEE